MDKDEGKQIIAQLTGIQNELELTRIHCIELENRIRVMAGVIDNVG